jgi:hypothetical protein
VPSDETAERDAAAARLRTRGTSYHDIMLALGFDSDASAYNAVKRRMLAIVTEPAEEVRKVELARLDKMLVHLESVVEREHIKLAGHDDRELLDDGPLMKAIETQLKVQVRRAALLGLDSPVKIEQTNYEVTVTGVATEDLK